MDNEEINHIAKGTTILLIGVFISKILTFIYRLIIARLGTEEYGLLSLGITILGFSSVIAILGMNIGITRYVAYYNHKNKKEEILGMIRSALKITSITSIILASLLFIFSNNIALSIFHNQKLSIIIKIIAFAIPFDVTRDIVLSATKGFQHMKYDVYSKNIVEGVSKIILTIILVYLGLSIVGATLAYTIAVVISTLFAFYYLEKKVFPFLNTKILAKNNTKAMMRYSIPLLFGNVLFLIVLWTDTIMIGIFKTASDVGIYNSAVPLSQILYIFPIAIIPIFTTIMTKVYAKKKINLLKKLYSISTRWIIITNMLVSLLLIMFPQFILVTLFGKQYESAYQPLIILTIGYFIYFTTYTSQRLLMIINKTRLFTLNSLITALLNVVLNYILIPIYGINGAAYASLASLAVFSLLNVVEVKKTLNINTFNMKHLMIIVYGIISAFLIKFISSLINLPVILYIILLIIIYLLILLITKSITKEDIKTIINLKNG